MKTALRLRISVAMNLSLKMDMIKCIYYNMQFMYLSLFFVKDCK